MTTSFQNPVNTPVAFEILDPMVTQIRVLLF